ncbi:MAG: PEP-CTERM sorting domain-containing protein [Chthoniobacterales bacterium]
MTATLTANNGAGMVIDSGTITDDLYYNGNGGMTAATDMTINATATVDMNSIHLYMKFSPPSGTGSSLTTYYTITLNTGAGNVAATQTLLGPTGEVEFGQPLNMVKMSWTGLNIQASDTFTISITEPGAGFGAPGHVALDGIQIIPEPSSVVLLLASSGLLALRRRKSQK